MSKNTNLSFLTDYITADITNGRIGINNASPTVAFDVVGVAKFSSSVTAGGDVSVSNAIRYKVSGTEYGVSFANAGAFGIEAYQGTYFYIGTGSGASASEKLRITSAGNVGIGTTSPAVKFEVNSSDNTKLVTFRASTGILQFYPYFSSYSGAIIQSLNSAGDTQVPLRIETSSLTISYLGSGAVTATSGVLSTTSDMTLKVEDGYIDNALEKISQLKPRYFYWKEESGLPTDIRQLGFYAQEVNQALGEEAANTPKNENDKWGIYDRGIIAMLTKGIQELKAEIETLKNK
jgi:hypothetical protein